VPFGPASSAAIPNLAADEDLRWANSLISTTSWSGRLLGYGLGGAVLAVSSAGVVFVFNAASFLGSAWLVLSIDARFRQDDNVEDERPRARDGFAFILADRALASILIGWCLMFLAINITTVANPPLADAFHVGSFGYGVLESMFAGGAVIGAFFGRWLTRRLEIPTLIFDAVAIAISSFVVALTSWFWLVLFVVLASASFDSLASVAGYSFIQERTPDRIRGRVFGALDSAFTVGNTIAFIVAGPLMSRFGPRGVYAAGGMTCIVTLLVLGLGLKGQRAVQAQVGEV
jgi:MFS family permease